MQILLQVEGLMLALIAVAALRARAEFDPSRPLTWLYAVGFVALAVESAILYARTQRRAIRASASHS
jgi:hypothetical protein